MKIVHVAALLMGSVGLMHADTITFSFGSGGTLSGNLRSVNGPNGISIAGVSITQIDSDTQAPSGSTPGLTLALTGAPASYAGSGTTAFTASFGAGAGAVILNPGNPSNPLLSLSMNGASLLFVTTSSAGGGFFNGTFTLTLLPQFATLRAGPGYTGLANFTQTTLTFNGQYNFGGNSGTNRSIQNATFDPVNSSLSAIPEPSSLALLGLGLTGFAFLRRRAA